MRYPAHIELQAALDAERAKCVALQAEIERITEAGRAHIRRAAAFEAQRDALADWKAKIEAQPPVAVIGDTYSLLWAQPGTMPEIVSRCGIKVGSLLYARPVPAAAPVQAQPKACRDDGRCQYAIDHGAEGLGHCPPGKCVMPCEGGADAGVVRDAEPLFLLHCGTPFGGEIERLKEELQAANARADQAEQLRAETLVHMGARCEELQRRLTALEEDKIRGSAGPGKFVMIEAGVYGSVKLPDHLFSQLDSRHFIAHSTADQKFMCANPEEANHLKSLGVQMEGITCDWFKIERL